ncbi:MAG: MOFRL family protein [Paracoccaceae bacterium]
MAAPVWPRCPGRWPDPGPDRIAFRRIRVFVAPPAAFADSTTVAWLLAAGHRWNVLLARNDSRTAFAALGVLFTTGPTGTNVNDFRAVFVT